MSEITNNPKIISYELDQVPISGEYYQKRIDEMKNEIKGDIFGHSPLLFHGISALDDILHQSKNWAKTVSDK